MVQPPAETARGGDWKQVFLPGHVGLEGAKCPGLPAGSRRRMRPREESPLIFPRRVGGIQLGRRRPKSAAWLPKESGGAPRITTLLESLLSSLANTHPGIAMT